MNKGTRQKLLSEIFSLRGYTGGYPLNGKKSDKQYLTDSLNTFSNKTNKEICEILQIVCLWLRIRQFAKHSTKCQTLGDSKSEKLEWVLTGARGQANNMYKSLSVVIITIFTIVITVFIIVFFVVVSKDVENFSPCFQKRGLKWNGIKWSWPKLI